MADLADPAVINVLADDGVSPLLPAFLNPITEIDLRPAFIPRLFRGFTEILGITSSQARSGKLARPFLLERQLQSNWCWASVGVALHRFFKPGPLTQCQLVQRTRQPAGINCCSAPGHAQCNVTELMSRVFSTIGLTRRSSPSQPQGSLPMADIQSDIAANCPIVCAMLGGGSAHFTVIVGWAVVDRVDHVIVDDPAVGGRLQRSLQSFSTNFNGRRWAQSTRIAR